MKRFIGLSFLFMAWAFYELSGGADFRPPDRPEQLAEHEPEQPAQAPQPAVPAMAVRSRDLVAIPSLAPPQPARPQPALPAPSPETTRLNRARASLGSGLGQGVALVPGSGIGESLQLARLDGRAPPRPAPPADSGQMRPADIRAVSGTRVNMREGPGTTYPVIARMGLGDKVEILSDPGNGWLRLRDMGSMRIGWISASLVERRN